MSDPLSPACTTYEVQSPFALTTARTAREKDALGIDSEGIDDGIVSGKVEDKCAIGAFPLLDIVPAGGARRKRVFGRVDRERTYGFFVVSEGDHGFACGEVP